jgi:hypothetical protein
MKRIRYDIDYLNKYCSENNIQLLEKYENTTRETKIKGLKL